ncbi:MAG: SAM-dependent methyltransferase [Thaumarchaeota archaeon]|nr:SAM-dependent methyltransferase [Nitrososphaerota archaeon]
MKIEEYLKTLPESIMTGEDVDLHDDTVRQILEFASVGKDDTFYHLGCGNGHSLQIALSEFGVKKAVGVDYNEERAASAMRIIGEKRASDCTIRCENILDSDLSDATVVLFWFSDYSILEKMIERFSVLKKGCRIVTLWGPLPGTLPDRVEFPYVLNTVPFRKAPSLREQAMAVFGTDCIDFVTAWEFAERYSKAVASKDADHDRFLTILQTLTIWINAKNLGIACGDEIPMPIRNYLGILKTYFNIEMEHLLDQNSP